MLKKKINLAALLIAGVVYCTLLLLPLFQEPIHNKVFALLMLVAILWMTEAMPLALTGLLIPVMAVFTQATTPRAAFSEFAHPVLFLFMGGFVLAGALSRHGLDKMLAHKLIGLAHGNFYWSAILLMLSTSFIACWVSNTSSTAMMLPLGMGMLVLVNKNAVSSESKFLMLGIAYSASIGGIITMISSPPNAIGAAILGISFSEWLQYSIPVFIITFPIMVLLLTLYFKPDRKMNIGVMVSEKNTAAPVKTLGAIFFITVTLWMLDGVLSPLLNIKEGFNALVAIFAIFLLCISRVLTWEEIMKSIQWEILLLFGGGLTLGMLIDKSGLGALLISKVTGLITAMPMFAFLLLIVIFTIVLTEFMSNTASAAMILPLLYTMAQQLELNPIFLVLPATIAASYGFMLPVGTPPNAMVFSTGLIPQKDMIKVGVVLDVLFAVILAVMFTYVLRP